MFRFLSLALVFVATGIVAVSVAHDPPQQADGPSACSQGKCSAGTCSEGKCCGTCSADKKDAKCCGTCSADKKDAKCCGTCSADKKDAKCCGTCSADKKDAKCCGTCSADKKDAKCCGTCDAAKKDAKCCGTCDAAKTGGACGGTCTADKKDGKCCGTCDAAKAEGKGCPVAAAMKNLPQTMFVVGDKQVCCPKAAAALADEAEMKIVYVVAGKKYAKPCEAKVALCEATEAYVKKFTEPSVCPESKAVSIAGKKACCAATAKATSAKLQTAMAEVKMTYVVGDKACGCPKQAKQLAKDAGKPAEFVVAGVKTPCDVTARLNLARAKYQAAVMVLAKAEMASETK